MGTLTAQINWNAMDGDQEGNRLIEMLEDTFLTQIIIQPKRANNVLEFMLVTSPDLVREGKVCE